MTQFCDITFGNVSFIEMYYLENIDCE